MLELPNRESLRATAHRAAFMVQGASAGMPRQCPDISWILRASKSVEARLGAFRAAFRGRWTASGAKVVISEHSGSWPGTGQELEETP